ncbi:MAG: hypothetical protein KBD01_18520 [Acidobacteria bacterium]|nr:hypothetical protein [Acidobacteriota bacterium]
MLRPDDLRLPALACAAALLAACAGGAPALVAAAADVGDSGVLLAPEIRLGAAAHAAEVQRVTEWLVRETRQALAAHGVTPLAAEADDAAAGEWRSAMLRAFQRLVPASAGHLRSGTSLGLGQELLEHAPDEASVLWLPVLRRIGPDAADGGYLPHPEGLVPVPGTGPDYEVPQAGEFDADSLVLDLLAVDARTGRVALHRRTVEPVASVDDMIAAIPLLVRNALRGVTHPPAGAGVRP